MHLLEQKRMRISVIGVLVGIFLNTTVSAETLTIATWGGAYEYSQLKAYFEPFTAETGVKIQIEQYNGGIEELRRQVTTNTVTRDLVDLVMADNIEACNLGLLETIDHSKLQPALDGTPAIDDFFPGALTTCGASQVIYATVLAFDVRAFPGQKPDNVADLFDIERFPGKRGLQSEPIAVLEWALRSYGVPRSEIYNLLSTGRGLDLAFKRLDSIKTHIIWWENGATPVELLKSGDVVMTSGYNGRFFDAAIGEGQPFQTIWDSQLYDYATWAIPRGSSQTDLARRFLRYATGSKQLAEQAKYISYGPARLSSSALVWKHVASGIDIRPHLPTFASNFEVGIAKDHEWYARIYERLKLRFDKWKSESKL